MNGAERSNKAQVEAGLKAIEDGQFHDSGSRLGQLCEQYAASDQDLAAAFAIMAARSTDHAAGSTMSEPMWTIQKLIDARLELDGSERDLKARAAGLDAMTADYGKKFKARLTELDGKVGELDEWLSRTETREQQGEEKSADFWRDTRKELDALKTTYETDIKTLKATYNEHLGLEAPANYWTKKKTGHAYLYWFSGFAFLLAIFGIGYAAWIWRVEIVDFLPRSKSNELGFSALMFFTVPALFIAWGLRVVLRLFNENLALAADAKMRSTMITTYLALTQAGSATAEERFLILNAIFRPPGAAAAEDNLSDIAEIIRQARSGAH